MRYKLLDNGKGVIVTRGVEEVSDILKIFFNGAPDGATAVFSDNSKNVYYRKITDEYCEISAKLICGSCKVRVAELSSFTRDTEWDCEGLHITTVDDKGDKYLVLPSDTDIASEVTELRIENEQIRQEQKKMRRLYNELAQRFKELVDGYDFT